MSDPIVIDRRLPRGGAYPALVELTLARLREFVREPEALFWTFLFPMVMSVAMALAFPSRGTQPVRVGVATGADELRQTLKADAGIALRDVAPGSELRALREGEVDLIVLPGSPPIYRFDPTREQSRSARLVVDNALKRAAGRSDPWTAREDAVLIAGSRYVDWL